MKKPLLLFVNFFRAIWKTVADPQFLELMIIAIIVLATGTIFYHRVEGWSLLDSLYFSITTLTTVGYGDLAPTTAASKLFTMFYILAGVGILLGFVNAIAFHTRDKSPLDKFFVRK